MSKISVVGGLSVRIEGHLAGQMQVRDVNDGTIQMQYGGTGWGIARALAPSGHEIHFATTTGADVCGRAGKVELAGLGVDTDQYHTLEGRNTASCITLLNLIGDVELVLGNETVYTDVPDAVTDEIIEASRAMDAIAFDGSWDTAAIDRMTAVLQEKKLFLDPASLAGAEAVSSLIGRFDTVKANRQEAEVLSGRSILSQEEMEASGAWFCSQGVRQVFLTMGRGGVFWSDGEKSGVIRPDPVYDVLLTGAGDRFSAALIEAMVGDLSTEESAMFAMQETARTLTGRHSPA